MTPFIAIMNESLLLSGIKVKEGAQHITINKKYTREFLG